MTAEEKVANIHINLLKAYRAADVTCAEGLPSPLEVIEVSLCPYDGLATVTDNVERTLELT